MMGLGSRQLHHLPVADGDHLALSRPCRCRCLFGRQPFCQHSQSGGAIGRHGRALSGFHRHDGRQGAPFAGADVQHAGDDCAACADDVRALGAGGTGHARAFRFAMGLCLAGAWTFGAVERHSHALQHLHSLSQGCRPWPGAVLVGDHPRHRHLRRRRLWRKHGVR